MCRLLKQSSFMSSGTWDSSISCKNYISDTLAPLYRSISIRLYMHVSSYYFFVCMYYFDVDLQHSEQHFTDFNLHTSDCMQNIVNNNITSLTAGPDFNSTDLNMFAGGLLWTTILIITILGGYFVISFAPSIMVEEPMEIPNGEDE